MKRAFEKRINRRRPYLVFIISISFGSFSTAVASCRLALDIRDTACCCCPAQHPPQRNPNCCCRQGPCSKLTPHVPRWKDSTHQLAHCFLLVRFVSLARSQRNGLSSFGNHQTEVYNSHPALLQQCAFSARPTSYQPANHEKGERWCCASCLPLCAHHHRLHAHRNAASQVRFLCHLWSAFPAHNNNSAYVPTTPLFLSNQTKTTNQKPQPFFFSCFDLCVCVCVCVARSHAFLFC